MHTAHTGQRLPQGISFPEIRGFPHVQHIFQMQGSAEDAAFVRTAQQNAVTAGDIQRK